MTNSVINSSYPRASYGLFGEHFCTPGPWITYFFLVQCHLVIMLMRENKPGWCPTQSCIFFLKDLAYSSAVLLKVIILESITNVLILICYILLHTDIISVDVQEVETNESRILLYKWFLGMEQ